MNTMEQGGVRHEEIISRALQGMNRNAAHRLVYRVLQGGASGSYAYRISLAADELVLKVTLPSSAPYVAQRARREALFYRHLARRVPLRVPRVIDTYIDDSSHVYILMRAYQASEPPKNWRQAQYAKAVGQLARFHAEFWDRTGELRDLEWLRHERVVGETELGSAGEYWHDLRNDERFGALLTVPRYQAVLTALQALQELREVVLSFPLTLCHGDCHIGNLLRDRRSGLIWADWQEVGLGRGPEDLSFFLERAYFDGADVPHEHAIRAYQESLEVSTKQRLSPSGLRQVMDSVELLSWLLSWPPYLRMGSGEQLAGVLDRIEHLADRLGIVA